MGHGMDNRLCKRTAMTPDRILCRYPVSSLAPFVLLVSFVVKGPSLMGCLLRLERAGERNAHISRKDAKDAKNSRRLRMLFGFPS